MHWMRFTALPNGLADGTRPRLSAHAAFRLEDGDVLADFPAALAWPRAAVSWEILLRRGSSTMTVPAALEGADQRDPDKWTAIFRPDLAVRSFMPPANRSSRRIRTYRNARLADRWRDLYGALATAPDPDRPAVGEDPETGPLRGFEAAGLWSEDRAKDFSDSSLLDELEVTLASLGAVPALGGSPEARDRRDILEFRRFFRRRVADPDAVVAPPSLDFHQVTTACSAHPGLLRPLGLVFDLVAETSWDEVRRELGGYPELVSVVGRPAVDETTPQGGAFGTDPSPWTRCRADADTFALAPASTGDLSDRLQLRLADPTRFTPVVMDVEAATFAATAFGGTLQLIKARRSRSTPTREAPPALRATGLGLVRLERALRFHERAFQRGDLVVQKMLDSRGSDDPVVDLVLDADDVVKGYRLDVRPEGGSWRSLVLRRGRVEATGAGWDLPDAEGWVAEVPASDDDGELYLGEEVLRWDGWSVAAPKPGTVIGTDDQLDPERAAAEPLPDLPIVVSYRPTRGTLVPLRYGQRYQFRARAVDIAGNGPGPDTDSDADASPMVRFGRLDAVRSPEMLMTAPRLPGEEVGRIVLRSQWWDRPAEDTGQRVAVRHVLPPRTTVGEAERHGVLDDAQGRPRPDLYAKLADRDRYALQDDPWARDDPDDPVSGREGSSRYFTDLPEAALGMDVPSALPVRFLPDPLARALQIARPDGTPLLAAATVLDLGSDWPERRSVRVVVEESSALDVRWDDGEGILRVGLPKAAVLPLRVSSRFASADLDLFGLTEWVAQSLGIDPSEVAGHPVGRRARAGLHWMFTPWRPLTLVHAVRQPLTEPRLPADQLTASDRQLGATASQLSLVAGWHAASTGRLDLLAAWDEGVDAGPGTPAPEIRRIEMLAVELDRSLGGDPDGDGAVGATHRPLHEHGDTRYRRISYRLEATTAFLDSFIEPRRAEIAGDGVELPGAAVPATVTVTGKSPDGPVSYRRDDGEGGDFQVVVGQDSTTIVRTGSIPDGEVTVRFASRPISRLSEPVAGLDIPASARPAAPVPHSVLPTFGWGLASSGSTTTSTRQPAGVRVWLERPWWSSGLGEELAVLYLPGESQPTPAHAPFVTAWGRDPVHASGGVRAALDDAAFPRRMADSVGLRPPGGPIVRAVPHRVAFDSDRDLWYCDIDLDLQSYWPFVRLALARWQPNAIRAADPPGSPGDTTIALSPVVLADIVQLAPGRVATVTLSRKGGWLRAGVEVLGPSFTTTSIDTAAPVVQATLQQRPEASTSDLDWSDASPAVTLTRQAAPLPSGDALAKQHRWSGQVQVRPGAGLRYRMVLEEYERYRTDGEIVDQRTVRIGRRLVLRPQPRDGLRLVYSDLIELGSGPAG